MMDATMENCDSGVIAASDMTLHPKYAVADVVSGVAEGLYRVSVVADELTTVKQPLLAALVNPETQTFTLASPLFAPPVIVPLYTAVAPTGDETEVRASVKLNVSALAACVSEVAAALDKVSEVAVDAEQVNKPLLFAPENPEITNCCPAYALLPPLVIVPVYTAVLPTDVATDVRTKEAANVPAVLLTVTVVAELDPTTMKVPLLDAAPHGALMLTYWPAIKV